MTSPTLRPHDPRPATGAPGRPSQTTETDPFVAVGEPRILYFGSLRAGDIDVYRATRPTLDAPFDQIARVDELSTVGGFETGLILDATGMAGYFTKDNEIHAVARDVPGGSLRDAGVVSELAIQPVFQDAWPSPDGLAMTFSAGTTPTQIYTASRASRDAPWSNITLSPINIAGVTSGGATLTADQRVMVWASVDVDDLQIFYSVRATPTEPFVDRTLLVAASSPFKDFEASIREDGCELFFGRALDSNNFDIYSLVAEP